MTTLVGYNNEIEVAKTTLTVPVSATHPVDAVNLKDSRLGLYAQLEELIKTHGVEKGRIRLSLGSGEQFASLTVNEYETLLMRYDLAEVLRNPLRFAAQKAKHAWEDPRAVPSKTIDYAKYDLVRALNRLVDALGLAESAFERVFSQALAVPASRFLRMKRSVDLLVSDKRDAGPWSGRRRDLPGADHGAMAPRRPRRTPGHGVSDSIHLRQEPKCTSIVKHRESRGLCDTFDEVQP